MKSVEHKQELSELWLPLSDFNESHLSDSTHVTTIITFQILDICISNANFEFVEILRHCVCVCVCVCVWEWRGVWTIPLTIPEELSYPSAPMLGGGSISNLQRLLVRFTSACSRMSEESPEELKEWAQYIRIYPSSLLVPSSNVAYVSRYVDQQLGLTRSLGEVHIPTPPSNIPKATNDSPTKRTIIT